MDKIKRKPHLLISSIITLVIGIWLLFTDYTKIINFIYFIVGGGLILTGLYKVLLMDFRKNKTYMYDGFIDIVIGILIMFVHNFIVTIILGLIFVLFPIIRIVKSNEPMHTFKRELPLLIIGLVIALSGDLLAKIFIKFLGVLFILLAIYLFVNIFTDKIAIIKFKTIKVKYTKNNPNSDNIIDVDYEEREHSER
jgi:uncharacterized membrane protein HdeD (DUF308 family)